MESRRSVLIAMSLNEGSDQSLSNLDYSVFVNGYTIAINGITRKYAEKKRMMRRVLRSILLRFVRYVGDIKKIEKRNVSLNLFYSIDLILNYLWFYANSITLF